jgi:hypothetical protein
MEMAEVDLEPKELPDRVEGQSSQAEEEEQENNGGKRSEALHADNSSVVNRIQHLKRYEAEKGGCEQGGRGQREIP